MVKKEIYKERKTEKLKMRNCICERNVWHSIDLIKTHKKTKKMLVRGYPYELNIRLDEPLYQKGKIYQYKYSDYPTKCGSYRVYIFSMNHFLGAMSEIEFTNKFKITK